MTAQQGRFDTWRPEFNCERPHDALGGDVPASRYMPSPRRMPARPPEPEYPGHFEVRYLSKSGKIKWKRQQLFVSQALANGYVALEESADGVWDLYFYDRLLARLDDRSKLRLHA
jgi:hypothetical protein